MQVSMSHIELHTAQHRAQDRGAVSAFPVLIAVSRNLVQGNLRIFLCQHPTVFKIVSQMEYRIGTNRIHTLPHES
jgi:hypothetical protein